MKRSTVSSDFSVAKNPRRETSFTTSTLRPCIQAVRRECPVDVTVALRAVEVMRVGSNGSLWFPSKGRHDEYQMAVMSFDGKFEIVAEGFEVQPRCFLPSNQCGRELFFINGSGAICKVQCGAGVSVLSEVNAAFLAVYADGILALRGDGDGKVLERRDASGALVDTLDFPFRLPPCYVVSARGQEVIYSTMTSLHKIDLSTKEVILIAGHCKQKGCQDGHGTHARFNCLRLPQYDAASNSVFIRDWLADSTSRFCHVDLVTLRVTTLEIGGLEGQRISSSAVSFPHLYAITADGALFYADLREDSSSSTFHRDMAAVDWSAPSAVEFRLAGGAVVHADRRVLSARSAYFAAMLRPDHGLRESGGVAIDLTSSPVDPRAFCAVLSYLATDELYLGGAVQCRSEGEGRGVRQDDEALARALLCVGVAELADQYQLLRLVRLAEARALREALQPGRDALVLPLLERTCGSGGAVEQACWSSLADRPLTVLRAAGEATVARVLERSPRLRLRLLYLFAEDLQAARAQATGAPAG